MSKAENNEQADADILECKADILRARDIIPGDRTPYKQKIRQESKSQISSKETISTPDTTETSAKNNMQEETEIPRFDLAEDIMAEQRKFTSIKRKAPDKKVEAQIRQSSADQTD